MSKNTAEIRQAFLDFFQSKGHQLVTSSSLVPNNDPTLLFTNAGMNQFKDVFLEKEKRNYSRATTSQRCVRAGGKHNDLENVGYTARHHTFFEMLGNFSFGDYFKEEAIAFAWELLTSPKWFGLPKEKLWVTVYETDDEAFNIWKDEIGVSRERIIRIGDNKDGAYASANFWQMGDTGPCGPCSEIFFDHGEHIWGGPPGSPEENGDRYIEIWNIVFIQFNRQSDGTMSTLTKPSVDTGMGLERISAVLQHVNSNYEIDLFSHLIKSVAQVTGVIDFSNKSLHVIADHIRSCAFLIADGVIPSNEGRGYVLRRIIRRALRHGNMLGAKGTFFYKLIVPLIEVMGKVGEDLQHQQGRVEQLLKTEEEQFAKTLERGLALLNEKLADLEGDTLQGKTVFHLFDTFGFPIDMTADVCRERNVKIDKVGFEQEMKQQRLRARKASEFRTDYKSAICINQKSTFRGYEKLELNAVVTLIFVGGQDVNQIFAGQEGIIILNETPFYGESGGQIGDTGELKRNNVQFSVSDTQKYTQAIGHIGKLTNGTLQIGDRIAAKVDKTRRDRIRLNHSATHLLHAALRQVLGERVVQKGSLVNDKYMRFDFSHFEAMKAQEIRQIEKIVNAQIRCNLSVETHIMDLDAAKACNVTALFGEKYDDRVRVVSMGNFSSELCCGIHAARTGDIGLFYILSESGTAAGVRRIEAVTGEEALAQIYIQNEQLLDIAHLVKANNSSNLNEKVRALIEHTRWLEKELEQTKYQQAAQQSASLSDKAVSLKSTKLLVSDLKNIEPKILRKIVDDLKKQLGSAVIVLASVINNRKVSLIAGVTNDLTDRIKAGELVCSLAQQIGGKGGGRPDIAQAAGTDVKALPAVLAGIKLWVDAKL